MVRQIDYKNFYQKYYKNIPNFVFFATLTVVLSITIIVCGIGGYNYLQLNDHKMLYMSFGEIFVYLLIGGVVALIFAVINKFITGVILSQKIVVTDLLLSLTGNRNTSLNANANKIEASSYDEGNNAPKIFAQETYEQAREAAMEAYIQNRLKKQQSVREQAEKTKEIESVQNEAEQYRVDAEKRYAEELRIAELENERLKKHEQDKKDKLKAIDVLVNSHSEGICPKCKSIFSALNSLGTGTLSSMRCPHCKRYLNITKNK